MARLQDLTLAEIHVNAAGQAWIETAHRAHDVNTLEVFGTVLLEDWRVLHSILVRPWSSMVIARARIPRRRRIRMIIGDLAIANHDVVRQNSADSLVESTADRVFRNL